MSLFHVICELPNASNLINGVKFIAHEIKEGVVITEEAVEKEIAAMFKGIPGYKIVDADPKTGAPKEPKKPGPKPKSDTAPVPPAASDPAPDETETNAQSTSGDASGEQPAGEAPTESETEDDTGEKPVETNGNDGQSA